MAVAKGAALLATLDFVERHYGTATVAGVLENVPAGIAEVQATAEIPFHMLLELWHAIDRAIGAQDPAWMEKAGAHSIDSMGTQLYGGIVRKATPSQFLNQPIKLFRLYYHSGDMRIVEEAAGCAVIRLVDFDEPDALFCRRQTGGLQQALRLAGGGTARVRHVRCANEGDAFCEWELTWSADKPEIAE